MKQQPPPWWTPADEAEQDVLVDELVRVAFLHRERCDDCHVAGGACAQLVDAIEAVTGWNERRRLRSRATWLAEHEIGRVVELRARAAAPREAA